MTSISLEDRAAILDLCADYNHFTDTGQADKVAELFAADGVFDGPPGIFKGRAEIAQFNIDIYAILKGSMHFTDNHRFQLDGGIMYHACYLALMLPGEAGAQPTLFTYEDELVKDQNT